MISRRKYIFPIIWLALIVYASLTPSEDIPDFSFIPHFDKIVHFCIYFGLAFLLVPAVLRNKKYAKSYGVSFILSIATGMFFELMQVYFTTSRSGSIYDEMANAAGALSGIVAYQFIVKNKRIESVIFKIE